MYVKLCIWRRILQVDIFYSNKNKLSRYDMFHTQSCPRLLVKFVHLDQYQGPQLHGAVTWLVRFFPAQAVF